MSLLAAHIFKASGLAGGYLLQPSKKMKCNSYTIVWILIIFTINQANIRADQIGEILRPLQNPSISSAKIVITGLNGYAASLTGKEKLEVERMANTIKTLFTEDYRVTVAISETLQGEKEAKKQEARAKDWLTPNALGSVNTIAANTALHKAKEIRTVTSTNLKNARLRLSDAMRNTDVLLNTAYKLNQDDRVIILFEMMNSINERSLAGQPFKPTVTATAVETLKEFKKNEQKWLVEAAAAERAANYEKAVLLFTKARNQEGRKRNAGKLGEVLEKNELFGSAIEYYEIAGNFERAKALKAAHPDLLADSFSMLNPEEIYAKSSPSCVRVVTEKNTAKNLGSGFFFKRGGYLLTNNHVVKGASEIEVKTEDGKAYRATVIASSEIPDLAVIKIDIEEHDTIKFSNSESIKIGSSVVLIGFPIKDLSTATMNTGRISNTNRIFNGNGCYQLDVSANHGNSGGPVLDAQGRMVGILTFGLGDSDIDRFNFAIRVDVIRKFLSENLGEDFSNN